jgi:tight adherence protein B
MVLNWMRPDLMNPMFDDYFGYLLISGVFIMEALGIFLIRKIVNIDV